MDCTLRAVNGMLCRSLLLVGGLFGEEKVRGLIHVSHKTSSWPLVTCAVLSQMQLVHSVFCQIPLACAVGWVSVALLASATFVGMSWRK